MDTHKLANLLTKLEGYVENVENSTNDPQGLVSKLEDLVTRLEKVKANEGQVVAKAQTAVASAPVSSAPSTASAGGFVGAFQAKCFQKVPALLECTKNDIKNEHLLEGVNMYIDMLKSQEAVLRTMEACKKPADMQFLMAMAKENK